MSHALQADFQDVRCIDASKMDWYPSHHRPVSLRKEEADAKGAKADTEGSKDTSGFQFKVFTLCYLTSFDEARCLVGCPVGAETCFGMQRPYVMLIPGCHTGLLVIRLSLQRSCLPGGHSQQKAWASASADCQHSVSIQVQVE